MIKVFSPTDKVFNTNGDAVIKATRAVVHKQDNGDYFLELECGLEFIDYIKANNIVVVDTPQGEQAFRFEKSIDTTGKKIKAKALHVFYDANNYLIADSYVVDKNCNDALAHLNAATDNTSPFTTYSDVLTVKSFRCVRQSLTEAINTVLERWGGHLVRDNFNLRILNSIGQDNGVVIQYKKNLKNIDVSEDWSGVCTKLLPVGKDGLLLDNLYLYSTVQYSIPFTKTVSFTQDIDEEDYETEADYKEALIDDLIAQGTAYLKTAQYPKRTYTLAANVEKITDVGDIVTVYDERLGVNLTAQVISFEYDVILGQYKNIEFGTLAESLSNLFSSVNATINKAIDINNDTIAAEINQSAEKTEEKILNYLISGYCVYTKDEILIIDQLPLTSAVNVLKINNNGISRSTDGVGGTFTPFYNLNGDLALDKVNVTAFKINGTDPLNFVSGNNETITGAVVQGLITGSSKQLKFSLPISKRSGSLTVSLTALTITIRDISGNKQTINNILTDSDYTVSVSKAAPELLTVTIDNTNSYGITNETPVSIEVNATIRFT